MGGLNEPQFVAVTGLAFEARIVAGPGVTVVCGGGQIQLRRSLEVAIRQGCNGILSFGIAGGLAPHLKPGSCIVARHIIAEHGRYASDKGWAQSLMDMVQGATPRRAALQDVSFGDIAGSDVPLASTAPWNWETSTPALDPAPSSPPNPPAPTRKPSARKDLLPPY